MKTLEEKVEIKINSWRIVELNRLIPDDLDEKDIWELAFESGEELDLLELKKLNEEGFIYHDEQTGIDYENEDGTVDYMNIYYFYKIN